MNNRKQSVRASNVVCVFLLSVLALLVIFPVLYTVTNSFMSSSEIRYYYSPKSPIVFHIIPDKISLDAYYQMLMRRPDYLVKFWNSIALTACIVAGQVIISIFAGYAFACSILAMLPVALLFVFFERELVEGIGFSNLK